MKGWGGGLHLPPVAGSIIARLSLDRGAARAHSSAAGQSSGRRDMHAATCPAQGRHGGKRGEAEAAIADEQRRSAILHASPCSWAGMPLLACLQRASDSLRAKVWTCATLATTRCRACRVVALGTRWTVGLCSTAQGRADRGGRGMRQARRAITPAVAKPTLVLGSLGWQQTLSPSHAVVEVLGGQERRRPGSLSR